MTGDELASEGRAPGGRPPFGYSWASVPDPTTGLSVCSYVVNPNEAETVRMLARRALEGASMLGLSRELDEAGIATRGGRPWHSSAVRAVLLNPAITGLRIHRREVAGRGTWEPILDRATWEEVRAVIADPARKRTRPARHHLLAGLVENPSGDRMNGHSHGHSAGGTKTRRVYATRADASQSLTIGAKDLEDVVVEAMLQRLDKALLPEPESVTDTGTEVAEIEAELVTLADLRGQGTISLAEWLAAREPLQRRLEAARSAAGTTRRPTAMTAMLRKPGAVRRAWEGDRLTFAEKREILAAMLERIVVLPATRGRWTPIEDRIGPKWRA